MICQKYLSVNKAAVGINTSELGASMAELFGKSIGPVNRQLCMYALSNSQQKLIYFSVSLLSLSDMKLDAAKILTSQIAIKGYFAGEAAGIRLANRESKPRRMLH